MKFETKYLQSLVLVAGLLCGCKSNIAEPQLPGPQWVVFTKSNSPLPDSVIHSIHVDRQNRAWFATNNGAASFSMNSWAVFRDSLKYWTYDRFGNEYPTWVVNSISVAKDQSVWFGLNGGGVVRYDQNSQNGHIWSRYNIPVIGSDYVSSIACDLSTSSKYGEVWLTSVLGVDRFVQNSEDGGVWQKLGGLPFSTSQNTIAAANQIDWSIWFGTSGSGLAVISYYPTLTLSRVAIPTGMGFTVNGIAFDTMQTVWVAMDNGVSVLNLQSGVWVHYNQTNTHGYLSVGGVHAIETDLGSRRWFGTDSGLVQLADTIWRRFTTGNSPLPDNSITAIKYDIRGNLWIGTRNGAAVYNPEGTRF